MGSGPTVVHAQGPVSQRAEDTMLVTAAGRGAAQEIRELLARASSPNVLARRATDNGSHSHATTALHAAAANGSLDSVRVLLEGGANPRTKQSGLRMLTPLHEAATVDVAKALLAAGASPTARDPREPDPAWYHRQRGRHQVAGAIAAAARSESVAARRRPQSELAMATAGGGSAPPTKIFPSMSSVEVQRVRQTWSLSGADLYKLVLDAAGTLPGPRKADLVPERMCEVLELECAICMAGLQVDEECILLPCGLLDRPPTAQAPQLSEGPTFSDSPSGIEGRGRACGAARAALRARSASLCEAELRSNIAGRLHAFHSACLDQWWSKSCRCPTCRRDVRQWLPRPDTCATPAKSAGCAGSSPCGSPSAGAHSGHLHSGRRHTVHGSRSTASEAPEALCGFKPLQGTRLQLAPCAAAARRGKLA